LAGTPHLFETMLLESGGSYRHLDLHLARLAASAHALGFRVDLKGIRDALAKVAAATPGALVVRLDLGPSGDIQISTREAPHPPDSPVCLLVSPFRVDAHEPLLRHKTTRRGLYDREHRRAVAAGCFDALFLNLLDHVTEGGITNIFARFGGLWVTPPLDDGLLPGTWRAAFAAEKGAVERSLTLVELLEADEIVVGNSMRGGVPVGELVADPVAF
jgi:para-aminobenzoate synthetase/4-amino-4-deoxychorismate lyase